MDHKKIPEQAISSADLIAQRSYFDQGATLDYTFRKRQLMTLKAAIVAHEQEIFDALYADLKTSAEESYATETGIVLAEINHTLKHLRKWMKPKVVKTNLLNFPASSRIYRDPLGVVLIIGSWNYPFQLIINPLVGAIAGGNCAVLKPSEAAPSTSAIVAKLIATTFDSGYITVYEGEGSRVVPDLMNAFRFDHIFYTGNAHVGRTIYQAAAEQLIPVTLELGGKSPAVVTEDADLPTAARRIALGKFLNAGQTCVAPDYVLVHERVKDRLVSELKKQTTKFFGEEPSQSSDYGRLINERRYHALVSLLDRHQGHVVYGGNHDVTQLYIAPTIVTGVGVGDALMRDEIFGPILPVIGYADKQEALELIQRFERPLSFYLFTGDRAAEKWWMKHAFFGGGCINNTLWHLSNPHLPFGGTGGSGIGAYHGRFSFETFTHAKGVMKSPPWFDPRIKYPPLGGRLRMFKMFIR